MKWCLKNKKIVGLVVFAVLFVIYLSCNAQGRAKSLKQRLAEQENISSMQRFLRNKRTYPHTERAQRLIAQKRYEEALMEYNAVLSRDPDNLSVAWDRLQLLAETSAPKVVDQAASELLDFVPDGGKILMTRGYSRIKTGEYSKARKDFKHALEDKALTVSEAASCMSELVTLLIQEGDFDQAKEFCEILINKYPEVIEHRLVYADLFVRSGSQEQADEQWQIALTLTDDPVVLRKITLARLEAMTESWNPESFLLPNGSDVETLFISAPILERQRYFILRARAADGEDQLKVDILLLQAMSEVKSKKNNLPLAERQVILTQLGNAAFDLERYELALTAYEMLLEDLLDPTSQVLAAKSAWHIGRYLRVVELLEDQIFKTVVPSPKLDTSLLLCSAYEKLGDKVSALNCFDSVMDRYEHVGNIPSKAAQVAAEAGFDELQVNYMLRSYQNKPTAKLAMDIGYLYEHLGDQSRAVQWMKRADELKPDLTTGLALAQILHDTGRYPGAISCAEKLLFRPSITAQEAARAYAIKAQSLVAEERYVEAAEAWALAHVRSRRSDYGLRRITALRLDGQVERAKALIETVSPKNDQERLAWLDEKAIIEQTLHYNHEALETVKQAIRIGPDAERYLWASMLALETGDLVEAELACMRALQLAPDNLMAKRQEVYVLEAQGKNEEAAKRLSALVPHLPTDYRLSRSLAYFYQQANNNSKALTTYQQAIDLALGNMENENVNKHLHDIKGMQDQAYEMARKFSYTLSVGVSLDDSERGQPAWNSSNGGSASYSYSIAELAYRPSKFGYRNGKLTELYGHITWIEDGSFTGEYSSPLQAGLGARVKPFSEYNLFMAVESLFSLEDLSDNVLQLRLAHSYSDTVWQKNHRDGDHKGGRYIHTFTEAGLGLAGVSDYLYTLHGRYGNSTRLDPDRYLSPFVYGTLNGYSGDSGSDDRVEIGLGLAFDLLSDHDRYLGYKKKVDVVFQLGVGVDDDLDDSALRGFIGLQFSGF